MPVRATPAVIQCEVAARLSQRLPICSTGENSDSICLTVWSLFLAWLCNAHWLCNMRWNEDKNTVKEDKTLIKRVLKRLRLAIMVHMNTQSALNLPVCVNLWKDWCQADTRTSIQPMTLQILTHSIPVSHVSIYFSENVCVCGGGCACVWSLEVVCVVICASSHSMVMLAGHIQWAINHWWQLICV